MEHSFDTKIAEKYGINEAILLNHIYFWIEKNKANEENFHEGTYWTYNSTRAFNELFPYMTEKQIKKALKHLRDEGILLTGNYNKSAYDRTLWYALSKKGQCIVLKSPMEETTVDNGKGENVPPIPDIKPDIKPDSNTPLTPLKRGGGEEIPEAVYEKKKKKSNVELFEEIIIEFLISPELKDKLYEWSKYKDEKKQKYVPTGMRTLIKKAIEEEQKIGTPEVCKVIDLSMASNYQGIVWSKLNENVNTCTGKEPKKKWGDVI